MNKLNTFLSFVLLSFCLLINVSYAEFSSTPITKGSAFSGSADIGINSWGDYTFKQIKQITYNRFINGGDDYISVFDTMVSSLTEDNIKFLVIEPKTADNSYLIFIGNTNTSFGGYGDVDGNINLFFTRIDTSITNSEVNRVYRIPVNDETTTYATSVLIDGSPEFGYIYSLPYTIAYSNVDVKKIVWSGGATWDGTTYYYTTEQNTPTNPEQPTMPTNSEIASAVQLFYNSVYQYSNAFDDFFVLYDTSTKLYTYVGHTRGNALGQVIVEPNGYYDGYKFDVQWWKFFLDEQEDSWNWQNISKYFNYYVYTSDGTIESLKDIGYSNISGLLSDGPWATSTTIIVYSTTDYPVKYITFTDESPEPNIQTGVIEGDQYTYDENLDITNNNYNPLDTFVTIDYPSTLVSRADFEGFMKIFNENKEYIVLPGNANWIILANNSLFNHFSSFIVMCTIFIIIERFMRG